MNNIKLLREKAGITQDQLAEKIGISKIQLWRIENNQSELKMKIAIAIAEYFKCDVNQVLDGDISSLPIKKENNVSIDIINAQACCGNGVVNYNDNIIGTYSMPFDELHRLTGTSPDNLKVISTIGDSMIPTINPGDCVIVDTSCNVPSSDGLYVISVGIDLMVKRVQINPINNSIIIKSDNPIYEQIIGSSYKDVKCIGRVLRIIRMERVS